MADTGLERSALPDPRVALPALLAVTAAFYLPTALAYHRVWTHQPYTHGYLVAGAAAWLLWRERHHLTGDGAGRPSLLPLAAGLSLLWMLGAVADAQVVMLATLPAALLCWGAVVLGRPAARRLVPIAAVFYLGVPFWQVLIGPLRLVTVEVSYLVLGILGIPARIDGSVIHITSGSFRIEDACAGFNYFMAGLSVGAIYALAFLRRRKARAAFVAVAVAMAIVGNWVRVASLIVIGHVTEMRASIIQDHGTYGWAIFFVGLLLLIPVARLLERREAGGSPERASAAAGARGTGGAGDGGGPVATPGGRAAALRGALAASAVVALGPILYLLVGALPSRAVARPALPAPEAWAEAEPAEARPWAWSPDFPGADEHEEAVWRQGDDAVVVDRLVYLDQRQEAELIGYGSRIAEPDSIAAHRLRGPVGARRRLVNEAIVREGRGAVLVWYWYRVGGIETASALKAKLLEVPAFLTRRVSSELIATSARCGAEDCERAYDLLLAFAGGR